MPRIETGQRVQVTNDYRVFRRLQNSLGLLHNHTYLGSYGTVAVPTSAFISTVELDNGETVDFHPEVLQVTESTPTDPLAALGQLAYEHRDVLIAGAGAIASAIAASGFFGAASPETPSTEERQREGNSTRDNSMTEWVTPIRTALTVATAAVGVLESFPQLTSSAGGPVARPRTEPVHSSTPEDRNRMREELLREKKRATCSICMTNRRNMVFQCGHSTCVECAETIDRCHLCRKRVTSRTPIFD